MRIIKYFAVFLLPGFLLFSAVSGCKKKEIIKISDAWVSETIPGSRVNALYLKISNLTEKDDVLTGAVAADFESVEFHSMKTEDGMMKMEALDNVSVKSGAEVEFSPGGMHIMLINNKKDLKKGDRESITLEFENAGKISIEAPVKNLQEQVN